MIDIDNTNLIEFLYKVNENLCVYTNGIYKFFIRKLIKSNKRINKFLGIMD